MLTEKTQLNCLKILNNPDDHLTVSFSPKKCHANINNYFVLAPEAVSKLVSLTLQILKIMNTPVCPYPPPLPHDPVQCKLFFKIFEELGAKTALVTIFSDFLKYWEIWVFFHSCTVF